MIPFERKIANTILAPKVGYVSYKFMTKLSINRYSVPSKEVINVIS